MKSMTRNGALAALLLSISFGLPAEAQITTAADLVNAVNNGAANDTVTIAAGTFELTAPLKPKAGMTIRGAGAGQTILRNATSWNPPTTKLPDTGATASQIETGAYLFSVSSNTHGITLSHMTLTGPELHGAYYGYNTDNLHLHDLVIQDFRWCGMRTFEMNGAQIHDCHFIDTGGAWSNGSPATSGGITGGGIYVTWMKTSEIWNNRFSRTKTGHVYNYYGIKGREGRDSRIHHNTINVNFSIEFPFENDQNMEIDHNVCKGVISIPKHAGGPVPASGSTFHIHHNYFTTSYAIELTRNGVEVHNNLFDFKTTSDGGNLCSSFGSTAAPGPFSFHDNLVKNPGRGVFWSDPVYNNLSFRNNHVIANTTVTPRTDGLFGFNSGCDFGTITIADNIIECIGQTRPLVRNSASNGAQISNNTLVNVSGTGNYANPDTGAPRGPLSPVQFTCGVNGEFTVDGWDFFETPTTVTIEAVADAYVHGGTSAALNFGTGSTLVVKGTSDANYKRNSLIRFDLAGLPATGEILLILGVDSFFNEGSGNRTVQLFECANDSWSETGVNWNNQPAKGALLSTFTVLPTDIGGEIAIDVSDWVAAQKAGDGVASFVISQATTVNRGVLFKSRESGTAPKLQSSAPPAPSAITLLPEADTYSRGGTYANDNFGTGTVLSVKESSDSNTDRKSFLRYDLSAMGGDAAEALLVLTVSSIGGESITNRTIELRQLADDAWSETGLTWNNQPANGTLIQSFTVNAGLVGSEIAINVTPYLNAQRSADGKASFVLVQPGSTSGLVSFHSRETSFAPRMEVNGIAP